MRTDMMKIILPVMGLLLLCGICAAEPVSPGTISTAIDRSALAGEQKAALSKQASAAIDTGIPAEDVAVIIKRGLSKNTDARALEEALGAATTARKKGLPVRPVLDRIEQGLAKGVPPARISAATKQLVVKLSSADALVDDLGRSGLKAREQREKGTAVHTVARALEKSIPEDAIRKIGQKILARGASLSRFAATVDTMAFFVETGMSVAHASGLVHKAIDKGYSENEMFMMQKEMSDMMRDKSSMNDIRKNMEIMMSSGAMGRGMGGNASSSSNPGMGSHGMSGMSGMGGMGGHRH